jgi:enterochelin esterase-like enzyme
MNRFPFAAFVPPVLLTLGACAAASKATNDAADDLQLEPIPSYREFQDCGPNLPDSIPCRMTNAPTRREAEQKLGSRTAVAWGAGDRWAMAYRAPSSAITAVEVAGGVQLPLSRLGETNLWVLALHLPGADQAVISLNMLVQEGEEFRRDTTSVPDWRGQHAPPEPREEEQLAGALQVDSLWSDALQTWRTVTVYLPPNRGTEQPLPVVYFADGQDVPAYARIVDPLIAAGQLASAALIGIWVSEGSPAGGDPTGPADDLRVIVYHEGVERVPGADSAFVVDHYRAHKYFFTEEVRLWAESIFEVSQERRWRAVHGVSSGGHFALTLGREHPDLYGFVVANSNGSASALNPPTDGWRNAARHYVSVGNMEQPTMAETLSALGDSLAHHGVPHVVNVYAGGHDTQVWLESFPRALSWWHSSPTSPTSHE